MSRNTRPVSWLKGARKDFEAFPPGAQLSIAQALTILAEGQMPDIAKPPTGLGSAGIKTPRREIELVQERLKRLKEMLK